MLAYLGPEGTFSHQAALEHSKGKEELVPFVTITELIKAVSDGAVEKGIVPIENSIDGGINATLDTLAFDAKVHITGEYILHIGQNLLVKHGAKKEDIKVISSISPAIGQCCRILNSDFKDVEISYTNATAASAKLAANSDGSVACIASAAAAEIYGLDILVPNCNDEKNNSTRFIIIEKEKSRAVTEHDKTSFAFTLKNEPGSLYDALKLLADSKINMTKIESRPIKTQLGTYVFFIDIDGNIDNATIYFALDKLRRSTDFFKFLGSYPAAEAEENK